MLYLATVRPVSFGRPHSSFTIDVPLSQENFVNGQKLTPALGLPNATKTNPPKKSMSVCCVCTIAAATKTNPPKKNSPVG